MPGTTALEYAFVNGLSFSMSMLVSPFVTVAIGMVGTRTCLCIGTLIQTVGLIGASYANQYWQLLLSQGVCFGIGMGFLYVGIAGVSSQWFTTKRSLANGISSSGSGFGGLVYSLAADAMIQRMGVGWAFRILGIISGVVNLFGSLLIRDLSEHIGTSHLPFDWKLLRRPEFLLVQAYGFVTELGYVILLFSLPNYADYIGLTSQQGSLAGAMLCVGAMIGRGLTGYLSDHFGPITVTCVATLLNGIFCLVIWPFTRNYGVRHFLTK
jgi:MFS family permease